MGNVLALLTREYLTDGTISSGVINIYLSGFLYRIDFSIRLTMTVENKKADEGKRDESGAGGGAANNDDLWGSDMYPERRGAKSKRSWLKFLFGAEGRESIDKNRCEDNVYNCVKNSKTSFIYIIRK